MLICSSQQKPIKVLFFFLSFCIITTDIAIIIFISIFIVFIKCLLNAYYVVKILGVIGTVGKVPLQIHLSK